MNAKLTVNLLRAASILSLLYCLGHMSGLPWTPGETSGAVAVVESMRSVRFEAVGEQRTYWDFYFGFGLIIGVDLAVQAAVLWWLSALARRQASALTPVLGVLVVGATGNLVLSHRYFFAIPAAFGLLIALLIAASIWSARRAHGAPLTAMQAA